MSQHEATEGKMSHTENVKSSIDYRVYMDQPCPFATECCIKNKSALTLDTGNQSARILGINTEEKFSFRKSITCTPLIRRSSISAFPTGAYPDLDSIEGIYMARPGDTYDSMQVLGKTYCHDTRYPTRQVIILIKKCSAEWLVGNIFSPSSQKECQGYQIPCL